MSIRYIFGYMIQIISESVSVTLLSSVGANHHVRPLSIQWSGRDYLVSQVGLHHSYKEGNVRHHVFSVVSNDLFFRLNLNTDTLHWTLEEVSDGLPD